MPRQLVSGEDCGHGETAAHLICRAALAEATGARKSFARIKGHKGSDLNIRRWHMFTSHRPNLYESSDGFPMEVLGRTGLGYREGERQMFVDSQVLTGPSELENRLTELASASGISCT